MSIRLKLNDIWSGMVKNVSVMNQSLPSVMLISLADGDWHGACARAGWQVKRAESPAEAQALLAAVFAVVVVGDWPHVATLRAQEVGATVPILHVVTDDRGTPDPLVDGMAHSPATAIATLGQWCPSRRAATLARLRHMFGASEIDALLTGLRRSLAEAIARSEASIEVAHRIAGIAGTLGFADVGAAWLRLAEGDMIALPAARRAALRAIAILDDG